ncbi:hypothetical protein PRIPAC_83001 [Pristionchus pacificus]|uniref:G protein-coupled receptor n=1 Tax=Pristionchus pacificus TaxID=54126 RepID=A0A2A6CQQ9_PRIPA|nr:hypothetical protein PRIPAC_83001 [Pristionchus pacificus]|eukprot:PDM80397.1 G protein-coupled receptor [Pristionchus pacificus]
MCAAAMDARAPPREWPTCMNASLKYLEVCPPSWKSTFASNTVSVTSAISCVVSDVPLQITTDGIRKYENSFQCEKRSFYLAVESLNEAAENPHTAASSSNFISEMEQMPQVHDITHVFIVSFVSLVNVVTIVVIRLKTPSAMKEYAVLLLNTSIMEFLSVAYHLLVNGRLIFSLPALFCVSSGPCLRVSEHFCSQTTAFMHVVITPALANPILTPYFVRSYKTTHSPTYEVRADYVDDNDNWKSEEHTVHHMRALSHGVKLYD